MAEKDGERAKGDDLGASKDSWRLAVEDGDIPKIRLLIGQAKITAISEKAQSLLVLAATKNQPDALEVFLSWGVPIDCYAKSGQPVLHAAAQQGAAAAVATLLRHRADILKTDMAGLTAIVVAIRAKRLPVVKALLRAGAELPPDEQAPGLPGVVREVELEKLAETLKAQADTRLELEQIREAEDKVWKAQEHHMKLLQMREQIKAGQMLRNLERHQIEVEAELEEAKKIEEQLRQELAEKKTSLSSAEIAFKALEKKVEDAQADVASLQDEDRELRARLRELRENWQKALDDQAAIEKAVIEQAKLKEEALDTVKSLEAETGEARKIRHDLNEELKKVNDELAGHLRNKQAAKELTQKAHHILHDEQPQALQPQVLVGGEG